MNGLRSRNLYYEAPNIHGGVNLYGCQTIVREDGRMVTKKW